MTLSVYTIEGRRGSVCLHDAFSVVNETAQGPELIDIIPAADLKDGCSAHDIRSAYQAALRENGGRNIEEVKRAARLELKVA
jgi:hypothetical protein